MSIAYGKLNTKTCVMNIDEAMDYLTTSSFKRDCRALLIAQHRTTLRMVAKVIEKNMEHIKRGQISIPRQVLGEIKRQAGVKLGGKA